MLALGMGLAELAATGVRFDPARLFASGTAGAWYDPSDLGAMAQNADGTGAAAVGMPVGRLTDKSGNGNHAVQAVAAARPLLRADGGGRLYLEFDGVDDCLRAAFACAQPWDRVSAIRQIGWTANDRIFCGVGVTSGNLLQSSAAPTLAAQSGGAFLENGEAALGANAIVAERHAGTGSRLAVGSGAYVAGNAGTTATDGLTIGDANAGLSRASNIRLYGVLMIGRALGDVETGRLKLFMAARAGVIL